MDHQAQMSMQQHYIKMENNNGHGQHPHNMMGMPAHMMGMQMPDGNMGPSVAQPALDSKPPGPTKKRKKSPARAQNAQVPPNMMKMEANMMPGPPGMNPHMMMSRDPNATIVAQNPFDDFSDTMQQQQQQPARMPPFMQGMPGHNPYGPQGQMGFPGGPGPQHQQIMMPNGQASMQQMSPNPMQMHHMQPLQMHPGPPVTRQNLPDQSDKIVYPEERCMITNPQNPNAPPIYPCGFCHREVHENGPAIFCESGCNFWYHRTCTGLSELAHQLLNSEIYTEWACDTCIKRPGRPVPYVKIKP